MLVYSKDSGRGGRNVVLGEDVGKKQVVIFVRVFVFTNRIDELCRPLKWKSFNGNLSVIETKISMLSILTKFRNY